MGGQVERSRCKLDYHHCRDREFQCVPIAVGAVGFLLSKDDLRIASRAVSCAQLTHHTA
jgi:hypothetical protein